MLTPHARLGVGIGLGVATWLALQFTQPVVWSVGHVMVSVLPFAGVILMDLSRPGWPFHGRETTQGALLALVSLPVLLFERKRHDEPAAVEPLLYDLPLFAAVTLAVLLVEARSRLQEAASASKG